MDIREWIKGQHSGIRTIFAGNVLAGFPREKLAARPDSGGNSIAWLVWHLARTEDVAINSIIRGQEQVLSQDEWASRLGVDETRIGTGMSDQEVESFGASVDGDSLTEYWSAVQKATHDWLKTDHLDELDAVPDVDQRLAGLPLTWSEQAAWVKGLWNGRPNSFFLGWVTIGHGYLHLGEMLSVKSSLGYKGL